jgi:ABC transporter with metal-binding/Fe-S-binding domain ATP-binding protein
MRLATLWSGGKDSTYATYLALKRGHKIKYLVTMFPEKEDSWMFHYPCIKLTKLQAKALGIKQIIKKTKGEKEKEVKDLKIVLEEIKNEIDGVVSGAIASTYQKNRIDKICNELKLKTITPIWQKSPEEILRAQLNSGFKSVIVGVFAEGFDESWIGREIDENCIQDLKKLNEKYGIHMTFEGGEAESFVLDCPIFKKKIKILKSEMIWDKKTSSGYLIVKKASLIPK